MFTDSQRQSFCDLVQTFATILDPGLEFCALQRQPSWLQASSTDVSSPEHSVPVVWVDEPITVYDLDATNGSSSLCEQPEVHEDSTAPAEASDLVAEAQQDDHAAGKSQTRMQLFREITTHVQRQAGQDYQYQAL